MGGIRKQLMNKYIRAYLNPTPPITNMDMIPFPPLLEELIELKEQKNEHTKEATEITQK